MHIQAKETLNPHRCANLELLFGNLLCRRSSIARDVCQFTVPLLLLCLLTWRCRPPWLWQRNAIASD